MILRRIFEPRSIAVVGASANPAKRGYQILRALDGSGYAGRIYAVNRRGGRIAGHRACRSIEELPEAADLAVLCTPAAAAPALVQACGERGIAGAVVLAVGFGESGEEGARLEARLRRAGQQHGVRIIGPNTSGLLNLPMGVNLIGARGIRPGGIALLVQSGNIALALMNELTERSRMGISICCGLGNEIDVGFGEALEYLGGHDQTMAVVVHVEGCRDTRAFLQAASEVTRQKPVVVIKSGRTAAGARAALSHTGAVAGPYDRLRAGLAQAGIVEVRRTDELLPVAETLATQPPVAPGRGVAILSDGGGQSTLVVDALHKMGVPLARLTTETSAGLRQVLGPAAAVRTPVDVAGAADADPGAFSRAVEILAADPAVGVVLLVGLFGGYGIRFSPDLGEIEAEAARSMAATMRERGKGLVAHSQYAAHESAALGELRAAHVPVIGSLEAACRATTALHWRGAWLATPRRWSRRTAAGPRSDHTSEPTPPVVGRTAGIVKTALAERRATLTETEARTLLAAAGLAFEEAAVVRSAEEAAAATTNAGHPVAIKLLSRHIVHKTDAGGVVLNVDDPAAAHAAFESVAANARSFAHANALPREDYAATVSPMLPPPVAELLIGAYRDPHLGPVLTVGAGGTWAEVLRDVAHRVLPVDADEVEAALGELKVHALLKGARGGRAVRLGGIVAAAEAVAECVMRLPSVVEVEVNPLFVYEERAVPVDARVVLAHPETR